MKFGDVVRYKAKDYVFLVATDEIVYLASIPNEELSKQFIDRLHITFTRGTNHARVQRDSIAWCFIVLHTDVFKDRIAHYGNAAMDYRPEYFLDVIGTLNLNDQKELQDEIINDNAVSGDLRELVKTIVISEA